MGIRFSVFCDSGRFPYKRSGRSQVPRDQLYNTSLEIGMPISLVSEFCRFPIGASSAGAVYFILTAGTLDAVVGLELRLH